MHCERNTPWKEDYFAYFMKKKLEGLGNIPLQETIKQKWSEKLKMMYHDVQFYQGGHPGTRPERVRCTR